MTPAPPPRLRLLAATTSDVVVVIARVRSKRWHILSVHGPDFSVTPGSWFRGQFYPESCQLSDDGALMSYCARGWNAMEWTGICRPPWLRCLYHEQGPSVMIPALTFLHGHTIRIDDYPGDPTRASSRIAGLTAAGLSWERATTTTGRYAGNKGSPSRGTTGVALDRHRRLWIADHGRIRVHAGPTADDPVLRIIDLSALQPSSTTNDPGELPC